MSCVELFMWVAVGSLWIFLGHGGVFSDAPTKEERCGKW